MGGDGKEHQRKRKSTRELAESFQGAFRELAESFQRAFRER